MRVSAVKEFRDVYLWRGPRLTPGLHCCPLAASPLFLHPLSSLISSCLNLPFGPQGRSWKLESIPYKYEMGDMERLLCPGAPQGPAWFQYLLNKSIIVIANEE